MVNKSMQEEDDQDKKDDEEFMKGADEKMDKIDDDGDKFHKKMDSDQKAEKAEEIETKNGSMNDKDLTIAYGGGVEPQFAKK